VRLAWCWGRLHSRRPHGGRTGAPVKQADPVLAMHLCGEACPATALRGESRGPAVCAIRPATAGAV